MNRSRTTRIDDAVGRSREFRLYVLTGGAGGGKTELALRFADAGLRRGERVVMLTHASAAQLSAQAAQLGVELKRPARDGLLLLLRYRPDFARRVGHAASTEEAILDLRRQILEHRPRRISIDTIAPLLDDGSASAIPAASIVDLLELTQADALATYPSDLGAGYDRRLEPLLQSTAGVLRLVRAESGAPRVELVSLRHPSRELPEPLASVLSSSVAQTDESLASGSGKLLLLRVTESASDDILSTLALQHEVAVGSDPEDVGRVDCDALVIEADHSTLEPARAIIRRRQSGGRALPILVVTRFTLRSLDRARLLRDGADEVLTGDMGMPELLQRLAGALRRGHLARPPLAVHEDETLTQRTLALPGELLDRERFSEALRLRTAHDDTLPFSVLRLTIEPADPAELRALGAAVLAGMRVNTGDLAALVDGAIAVYLHGAARRDIAPFIDRLRAARAADAPALRIVSACYPAESTAVRQLVAPLEVR